jgi:CubicO group peptidase (beta-lactamase class C family)
MKLLCTLLLCLTMPALALDGGKLAAIHPAMEEAVKAQQAAGIVTLVIQIGRVLHHDAAGMADIAQGRAMEKDALFWIASMTKS